MAAPFRLALAETSREDWPSPEPRHTARSRSPSCGFRLPVSGQSILDADAVNCHSLETARSMPRPMPLAFAKLQAAYVSVFRSEDFIEGRKAEAENRAPVFHGR